MRRLALALLLAGLAPVQAAQLHIPAPVNGAVPITTAKISVRLVDSDGHNVVAFNDTGLATAYTDVAVPTTGLTLTLAPQPLLSIESGGATYYQLDMRWSGGVAKWRVQLADVVAVQELRDLVAAAAIVGNDMAVQLMEEINADAEATAADRVQTGLDATATAADRVQTGLDATATAADRVQTGLDAIATAADRVQTGLDATATAADRVQTGLDVIATGADRTQTGLDAVATAADRVQTGLDATATATDRAAIEDIHVAMTLLVNADAALVTPDNYTILYPSTGNLAGVVCDVVTAPVGGAISLDLLTGSPLASIYGTDPKPSIVAGDTTTLTGTPQAIDPPVALTPRTPVQLQVISAPSINVLGTMALISDLPDIAEAGTRYLVEEDGHVWQRNLWDAVTWTDTGLPVWPGQDSWLGAVANYAGLSALTPASGDVWITADTAHRWAWSGSAWDDQGLLTNFVDGHTFIPIASSASLPTSATAGVWYMTLNTGHLYRNDAPPWLDMGLATAFPGAGLRCSLYIYPTDP